MTVKEALTELDFALGEIYDQVFYDDKPYEFDKDEYEALCMAIEALKQNQWIPCSERLPSKGMPVLVNGIMEDAPPITISTDAPLYYKNGWINAWMPLPKPWKGEKE